jgi:hypothetical protein
MIMTMTMTMTKLLVLLTTISLVAPPPQSAVVVAFSTDASKKSHINVNGHRRHRGAAPPTTIAAITTPSIDGDGTSNHHYVEHSRRSMISQIVASCIFTSSCLPMHRALAAAPTSTAATSAVASTAQPVDNVYFGAGCFWHVQHEMVSAERSILNRKDGELTSLTGYAGGTNGGKGGTDKEGRVCYHNFQSVADYGQLGHGEVVGIYIPRDTVGEFAEEYFKLFGTKGERADPMDKGGEYR